jgi:hypothetical protein
MAIGFVQKQPDGTHAINFKARLNWGDADLPWPDQSKVVDLERTITLKSSRVGASPTVIDDPVLAGSIAENCYARLFMKMDRQSGTFRPAFELRPDFVDDHIAGRSVIFGGWVEIRAEVRGNPDGRLIAQVGPGQCLWMNPSEEDRSRNDLRTTGVLIGDTALRVRPSPNFKRDDRETDRVFVRIHNWYEAGVSVSATVTLGDLVGPRQARYTSWIALSRAAPSFIGRWKALRPEMRPMPPARLLMTAVVTASFMSLAPATAPPELMRGTRPMYWLTSW